MNPRPRFLALASLVTLGPLVACGASVQVDSATSTGGSTATSTSSATTSTATATSSSTGVPPGCGGGCPGPTSCFASADCAVHEFCYRSDCTPQGTCEKLPFGCPADNDPVCGCDGMIYENGCVAAEADQNAHLSIAECSALPPGQFPCGTGFCGLGAAYCRQAADGTLACAQLPPACANNASCACLAGNIDCGVCSPTKGGGALATECKG